MISVTPELQQLLAGGGFARADLYTFTPKGLPTTTWTSADLDVSVDGVVYIHTGARFERGQLRLTRGLETDTFELTITVDPLNEPLVSGVPLRQAAQKGQLDGAQVELDWCYLSGWGPPPVVVGVIPRFVGMAAAIEVNRTGVKMTVKSWLSLLDTQVPAKLYSPSCRHTLGDSDCGVDIAAHAVDGTVGATASTTALSCSLSDPAGTWDHGFITMTSGICTGIRRCIRSYQPGSLTLTGPLPWAPAEGDGFMVYPGCDKTLSGSSMSCSGRFGNVGRFGGTPYIPVPETAY